MDPRRIFGNKAEVKAARFLVSKGYKILEKQFSTKFGEVDIVARDGGEIVFVEVKARRTAEFGYPEEAVTPTKIRKIALTAEQYMREKALEGSAWRIDVIAINPKGDVKHFASVGE